MIGLAIVALKSSMNAGTLCFHSSAEAKLERRRRLRERMPNPVSTWFGHEPCLGVDANRIRREGSQATATMPTTQSLPARCPSRESVPK